MTVLQLKLMMLIPGDTFLLFIAVYYICIVFLHLWYLDSHLSYLAVTVLAILVFLLCI